MRLEDSMICYPAALKRAACVVLASTLAVGLGCARLKGLRRDRPAEPAQAAAAIGMPSAKHIVPVLVQSLKAEDPEARYKAAVALESLGAAAAPAVAELIDALGDRDKQVRNAAGDALTAIGKEAVPSLQLASKDPNPRVRSEAVRALTAIEPALRTAEQPETKRLEAELSRERLLTKGKLSVRELIDALKSASPDLRRDAVELLEVKDSKAAGEAISVLVSVAINDPAPHVRYAAAWQLAKLGQAPASALVLALSHTDPTVRKNAAEALGEIGPATTVVIPSLIEALKDAKVRDSAVLSLSKFGKASIPALVEALKRDDIHEPASAALVRIGEAAAPALAEALKDDASRYRAADVLVQIGTPATDALIESFKDERFRERVAVLVRIGEAAMPDLINALRDKRPPIRQGAALTLCEMGARAADSIPAVVEALRDHPDELDLYPIWKFGAAGAPALLRAMTDTDPGIRLTALQALGRIQPIPREAFLAFVEGLNDKDTRVRNAAAVALTEKGPDAVPTLMMTLEDPDVLKRRAAADALGFIGPSARKALPTLRRALEDPDAGVRKRSAYAIGQLGRDARSATEDLTRALLDQAVRPWAYEALERMGAEAVPALKKSLRSDTPELRYQAAFALGRLAPEAEGLEETFREALRAEDAGVRYRAVLALGQSPRLAEPTIPALILALEDDDEGVRFGAAHSLSRIGPPAVFPLLQASQEESPRRAQGAKAALRMAGPETVDTLILALKEPPLKDTASELLVRMGGPAVPALIGSLDERDLQKAVVNVLTDIGDLAVPALKHASKQGKVFSRRGADEALAGITGKGKAEAPAPETAPKRRKKTSKRPGKKRP